MCSFFFFQAEDGIRVYKVTGVQTCALPICVGAADRRAPRRRRGPRRRGDLGVLGQGDLRLDQPASAGQASRRGRDLAGGCGGGGGPLGRCPRGGGGGGGGGRGPGTGV